MPGMLISIARVDVRRRLFRGRSFRIAAEHAIGLVLIGLVSRGATK